MGPSSSPVKRESNVEEALQGAFNKKRKKTLKYPSIWEQLGAQYINRKQLGTHSPWRGSNRMRRSIEQQCEQQKYKLQSLTTSVKPRLEERIGPGPMSGLRISRYQMVGDLHARWGKDI